MSGEAPGYLFIREVVAALEADDGTAWGFGTDDDIQAMSMSRYLRTRLLRTVRAHVDQALALEISLAISHLGAFRSDSELWLPTSPDRAFAYGCAVGRVHETTPGRAS